MPEDSVASSHPIIVPVNRPEEITAVFDSISYNKVDFNMVLITDLSQNVITATLIISVCSIP